ncbi:MAG: HAD family phosphatase [Prevotellaceae bacterium]|jgi:HAD superfamily hydrolase (TIGR01509 family)|nr:HAD family phosphatase [Prevotellaceae bacterium]
MIAVIFDMDGVLVDNARFHEQAFAEYFKKYGITLKPEMYGRGNEEIMSELFPNETLDRQIKFAAEKEAYYRKIYAPHIQPVAGLIELLKALKDNDVLTAVGSSAIVDNIDFVFDKLQIRNYFDAVVAASMVARAKPAPDIYLKASELLDVKPENCLVFEDATAGIAAAKSAGAKVVGLATSLSKEELANTDADKVISDFTEITVDEIKQIITQSKNGRTFDI